MSYIATTCSSRVSRVYLLFLLLAVVQCSHLNTLLKNVFHESVTVEEKPAIRVQNKWDAFALLTYYCESKSLRISEFDYAEGVIRADWVYHGKEGGDRLRAKPVFRYTGHNGFLKVEFAEVESKQVSSSQDVYGRLYYTTRWQSDSARITAFIPRKNRMITILDSMRNDSGRMREYRNFFRSEFRYNYLCLRSIAAKRRSVFFSTFLAGSPHRWNVPLFSAVKNEKEAYRGKKIEVVFKDAMLHTSLLPHIADTLHIHLFSNDSSWIGITPGTVMQGEARLDSVGSFSTHREFYFYLIE